MKDNQPIGPPKWPLKVLRKIIRSDYLEELEGDIYEVFQDNLDQMSVKGAKRRYAWDCLKLIQPKLLGMPQLFQKLNSYTMLKTNLKIAFRIFAKNKSYTAINVIGLAGSLAVAILIFQYVHFELSYESYNPNSDDLARITLDFLDGNIVFEQDCETYPPMGPLLKNELSEVKEFTRAYHIDELTLRVDDSHFRESRMYAVDPSFFNMFHYPFQKGDQTSVFQAPFEMVLTESHAIKLFGTDDIIGETIQVTFDSSTFKIVGIIKDSPANTHLKFNMLISYKSMKSLYDEKDDNWNGNNTYTYLQLANAESYSDFLMSLEGLNNKLQKENILPSQKMLAQPVNDIHLYSHKPFEAETNGNAKTVYFLLGVAVLIVLIALFNYINLSTSRALDRANEVGIRKVHGSTRPQLIAQFYTESFLMFLFGGFIALIIIRLSFNYFRNLAQLPTSWYFLDNIDFWIFFSIVLIISIGISGSIPALILSSFKPVAVLKGKFTHSISGNRLRQLLIVLQFSITVFLLIQTLVSSAQLHFMRNKELGLETENVVVWSTPDNWTIESYKVFKADLLRNPLFKNVAISQGAPGMPAHQLSTTSGVNPVEAMEKHSNTMYLYFHDHEFFDVMGMELIAGENFIDGNNDKNVIVSEETLRKWNISNPNEAIGTKLDFWGEHRTVTGVIKDFHQFSPKDKIVPIICLHSGYEGELINVKVTGDSPMKMIADLETVFKKHFPESPFDFFFLDQEFDRQYQQDIQFQQLFGLLSGLAILIACLGLFGLASFTISKRSKEIGVRKVLGASVHQLILLVSSQFMKLVGISILIALPIAYFGVNSWLESFTYRINLSVWIFILPALLTIGIAFISIFGKTYVVSTANPANSLRDE